MPCKRMESLLRAIPPAATFADIGSDHGQLVTEAWRRGHPNPIAVEAAVGPWEQTVRAVRCRRALVDVRFGSGLKPLQEGEVNTVVIAGLGGKTILEILDQAGKKIYSYPHWLFQPLGFEEALRHYLIDNGFGIVQEWVICQRRRFYLFIEAAPVPLPLDPRLADVYPGLSTADCVRVGPKLLLNPAPDVHSYFQQQQSRQQRMFFRNSAAGHESGINFWKQVVSCHLQFSESFR